MQLLKKFLKSSRCSNTEEWIWLFNCLTTLTNSTNRERVATNTFVVQNYELSRESSTSTIRRLQPRPTTADHIGLCDTVLVSNKF